MKSNYIRFDWAMACLLRNKTNFGVLEGFLTTLLNEKIVMGNYWKVKAIRKSSTNTAG